MVKTKSVFSKVSAFMNSRMQMMVFVGLLFVALVGCTGESATVQAVERFTRNHTQGITYVGTHKVTGEGEFQVDEFRDAAGGVYEVAQSANEVVSFNSMKGGTLPLNDSRPSIQFADAEKIGVQTARLQVRDFDSFAQRAVYQPEAQGKGNTFTLQWIGTVPAPRSKNYYFEGIPVPPPPYRVLVTLNSKGDLVQFLNETY